MKLLAAAAAAQWAITEPWLNTVLEIAARENSVEKALEARRGEPMEHTYAVEIRDGVAVLPLYGPMFRHANLMTEFSGATSYGHLARDFTAALESDEIKAIVLNIDSPGGEVNGCQAFAQMVFDARGKKPIVAFIGGTGCSAAYWIASACDVVVASQTAIVGSIGVCAALMDTSARDRMDGIKVRQIVSSNAPKKNPEGITNESVAALKATLDALESVFVGNVARNRGVSVEKVLSDFGQGGTFVAGAAQEGGTTGLEAGLVDEIGSFEEVIARFSGGAKSDGEGKGKATRAKSIRVALGGSPIAAHKKEDTASASADASTAPSAETPMAVERDEDLHKKVDALQQCIDNMQAKMDGSFGEQKELHAKTHGGLDEQKGMHEKTHGMLDDMMKDDGDGDETPAEDPGATRADMDDAADEEAKQAVGKLPAEIVALTTKTDPQAVIGEIMSWNESHKRLATALSENESLKSQIASLQKADGDRQLNALVESAITGPKPKFPPAARENLMQIGRTSGFETLKAHIEAQLPMVIGSPRQEPKVETDDVELTEQEIKHGADAGHSIEELRAAKRASIAALKNRR